MNATDSAADWTPRQRRQLWMIERLGTPLLLALGASLRFRLPRGLPTPLEHSPPKRSEGPAIYIFWHRELMPIAWYCRRRGIGILISQHFDGEWIARVSSRLGYRCFRGSSTRGGQSAMEDMTAYLRQGGTVALTVDGPRGPRQRMKPGAVYLARETGAPVYAVHASMPCAWKLPSWDALQIPWPFSRIVGCWSGPFSIPHDAPLEELETRRQMLEAELNRLGGYAPMSQPGS